MDKSESLWHRIFQDDLTPREAIMFGVVIGLLVISWLLAETAQAETSRPSYTMMSSTPDISISATATVEVADWSGRPIDWISIKNDCADDLYFDLRTQRDGDSNNYPILLKQGEVFTFSGRVHMVHASHGGTTTESCTISLIPAR